ncbi:hypothetical protein E1176_02545, partial [Fulvivirga sp. RKSG066]|nr:hypothetical protein [Fulvivirga aurantia]
MKCLTLFLINSLFFCLTTLGQPTISDNLKIAFVSYKTGSAEIYLMNPDGTDVEQITSSPENNSFPFQIDNKTIGFTRTDSSNNSEKFKINIYTKIETPLEQKPLRDSSKWEVKTPNGKLIAFIRSNDYSDRELFVYDLESDIERKLTYNNNSSHKSLSVGYSWSSDNKKLLFMSGEDWYNQVMRIYDVETDSIYQVTSRGYMNAGIRWLDNQNVIANLKIRDETTYEIYRINVESGKITALTEGINLHPDVSPDGKWIVFESQRHGNHGEVYIMKPDGSEQIRLTNNPD